MVICDWFLVLSVILSEFILVVACISTSSFIMPNNIPSYGYTIIYISASDDRHLGCFHFGATLNNAAANIYIQVSLWTFSFVLNVYLLMILLSYMITLLLTIWGTAILFSKEGVPLYIPTSYLWGFWFLHILGSTCHSLFLGEGGSRAILVSVNVISFCFFDLYSVYS